MASPPSLEGWKGKKDRGSNCKGQRPLGPGISMMPIYMPRVAAGRPACLPVCMPASSLGSTGTAGVWSPPRKGWVTLGLPAAEGTSPSRALRCDGGTGLSGDGAALLFIGLHPGPIPFDEILLIFPCTWGEGKAGRNHGAQLWAGGSPVNLRTTATLILLPQKKKPRFRDRLLTMHP